MPLASYVTEVSEIDKRNRLEGCLERVPSRRAGRWRRSLAALAGFLRRVGRNPRGRQLGRSPGTPLSKAVFSEPELCYEADGGAPKRGAVTSRAPAAF